MCRYFHLLLNLQAVQIKELYIEVGNGNQLIAQDMQPNRQHFLLVVDVRLVNHVQFLLPLDVLCWRELAHSDFQELLVVKLNVEHVASFLICDQFVLAAILESEISLSVLEY